MSLLDDVLARIKTLSPQDRAKLEQEAVSHPKWGKALWVPNPGPQTSAYYSQADVLLYGGSGGGGKLSPLDSPVLTPFGWKPIGDLRVGSRICATDGTSQEVIAVYPQGVKDIYRVTMRDGGSIEVGEEHLWLAWPVHKKVKKGNEGVTGQSAIRKYTTRQIMDEMSKGVTGKHKRVFAVPVNDPVCLNVAGSLVGPGNFVGRPIDPYFLGLLIGDGSMSVRNAVRMTTMDDEIASYIRGLANEDISADRKENSRAIDYRFIGEFRRKLVSDLTDLGLVGHRSGTKFIPRQYLMGDVQTRWALINGLMDTGGWVENKRSCYYTTISKKLSDDFVFLARSLGAVTSVTEKYPTFTGSDGSKKRGDKAYCVRIRIANPEQLFRLERKIAIAKEINHQSNGRFIESIEFSRKAESVCIGVSHSNSLYIGDDFIVTHNSDLGIGLAFMEHQRSLILRRRYSDIGAIIERAVEINGTRNGYNGTPPPILRTANGKFIQFGANQHAGDEGTFQGRPYDLKVFDEACHFLESQISFHMGWLRSSDPNQRCRAVLASNPPVDSDGDWLIGMFRPWLDLTYPNPAENGDLRWFITVDGDTNFEVPFSELFRDSEGRHCYDLHGTIAFAHSRTFIPAYLDDNPFLSKTNYKARLDALPEPLRSAIRDGNFMLGRKDAEWQVIPTQWVIEAQTRWSIEGWRGKLMTAMAMDPAGGGNDSAELIWRYGHWFAEPVTKRGEETADGSASAATIIRYRRDAADVIVDVGGGYGGSVTMRLTDNGVPHIAFQPANVSTAKTLDRQLKFANKRAEAWWRMREALDPDQEGGSQIALPPSPELRSDLTAPTYSVGSRGIIIEAKDSLRKRLGRSTGKGDACVMCNIASCGAVKRGLRSTSADPRALGLPRFAKRRSGPLTRKR